MKKILLLSTIILLSIISKAQKAENIRVTNGDENTLIISFDITNALVEQRFDVSVLLSVDNGKTFPTKLKALEGDLRDMSGGKDKTLTWNVFEDVTNLEGKGIKFKILLDEKKITIEKRTYAMLNSGLTAPIGLKYAKLGTWGYYASFRLNTNLFKFKDYDCINKEIADYKDETYYKFNKNTYESRLAITGGITREMLKNVHIYIGGGFGAYRLLWEIDNYEYGNETPISTSIALQTDWSILSYELEAGLMVEIWKLSFSAGVSTMAFNQTEAVFGIGYKF